MVRHFGYIGSPLRPPLPSLEISYEFGDMECPCGRGAKEDDPLGEPDWKLADRDLETPLYYQICLEIAISTLLPMIGYSVQLAWE